MELERLVTILPPPCCPTEVPTARSWARVESDIGVSLPSEYKDFVERYGTGSIAHFLYVFNPWSCYDSLNLIHQARQTAAALRALGQTESVPYPLYPDNGGLLSWAGTVNGDVLYWLMSGAPSQWPICVNESRAPEWERYDCSMIQFILRYLSGTLSSRVLPPVDSLCERVTFAPVRASGRRTK